MSQKKDQTEARHVVSLQKSRYADLSTYIKLQKKQTLRHSPAKGGWQKANF